MEKVKHIQKITLGNRIDGIQYLDGETPEGSHWFDVASVVVEVNGLPDECGEANVKLFMAAPELLEALKMMIWASENGEHQSQVHGRPRLCERHEIVRNLLKRFE